MLRFAGKHGFTQAAGWEPHTIDVLNNATVFGSRWPLGNHGNGDTLWTLVNRVDRDVTGPQLSVASGGGSEGHAGTAPLRFYDCYHGEELFPDVGTHGLHGSEGSEGSYGNVGNVGSGAKGSDVVGSGAKGSDVVGSGAKGSGAKGSGAKGSGAKGSGARQQLLVT